MPYDMEEKTITDSVEQVVFARSADFDSKVMHSIAVSLKRIADAMERQPSPIYNRRINNAIEAVDNLELFSRDAEEFKEILRKLKV